MPLFQTEEPIIAEDYSKLLDELDQQEEEGIKTTYPMIDEYPTMDKIVAWLRENWNKPSQNVAVKSLRQKGHVVGDTFDNYLNKTAFDIDEEGNMTGFLQSGALKAASKTPRHLLFQMSKDLIHEEEKPKGYFNLGEALHACILEPTRFSRYIVTPNEDRSKHEGCDALIKFWDNHTLSTYLKSSENEELAYAKFDAAQDLFCDKNCIPYVPRIVPQLEKAEYMLLTFQEGIYADIDIFGILKPLALISDVLSDMNHQSDSLFKAIKLLKQKNHRDLAVAPKGDKLFDPLPLQQAILLMVDEIRTEIEFIKTGNAVIFRILDQKKVYIDGQSSDSGLESVTQRQFDIIKQIKMQYFTYGGGILPRLFVHSKTENSIYAKDYRGLPLKVRPDAMQFEENAGFNMILSIKSTAAPDLHAFRKDTLKFVYELGEGMYQKVASEVTGRDFKVTFTLMLQTVEPYDVALFLWSPEELCLAVSDFEKAIERTKTTLETGEFTGNEIYAEEGNFGMIPMGLPKYAFKEPDPTTI
jgi:hypothetical protein